MPTYNLPDGQKVSGRSRVQCWFDAHQDTLTIPKNTLGRMSPERLTQLGITVTPDPPKPPPKPPTREQMQQQVHGERDRRLQLFTYSGVEYDFDSDSRQNIAGAYSLALAAVIHGAQPGDLRWADPDEDFTWIAHDNSILTMDAQTCLAFGQAAASWKADHIRTARAIKDLDPVPDDYADDSRWPTV